MQLDLISGKGSFSQQRLFGSKERFSGESHIIQIIMERIIKRASFNQSPLITTVFNSLQ